MFNNIALEKYDFSWGNKSSDFPHHYANVYNSDNKPHIHNNYMYLINLKIKVQDGGHIVLPLSLSQIMQAAHYRV